MSSRTVWAVGARGFRRRTLGGVLERLDENPDHRRDVGQLDRGGGHAHALSPLAEDNHLSRGVPRHPEVTIAVARIVDLQVRRVRAHPRSMDLPFDACRPAASKAVLGGADWAADPDARLTLEVEPTDE